MFPTKSSHETETKEFEYNEDPGIRKGTFYLAIVICDPQATCQGKKQVRKQLPHCRVVMYHCNI